MESTIERYLDTVQTSGTRESYRTDLRQLADALQGGWEMLDISRLIAWRNRLSTGYRPTTVNRKVSCVRAFCRWLYSTGVLATDMSTSAPLTLPKLTRVCPYAIRPSDVRRMKKCIARPDTSVGLRDAAMVWLLTDTGIRVSELIALNLDDYDVGADLRIRGRPKCDERILPIDLGLTDVLDAWLRSGRPAMIHDPDQSALLIQQYGERLTRQGVWFRVKEIATRAGVEERVNSLALRAGYAASLFRSGARMQDVQDALGLARPWTALKYRDIAHSLVS